MKAVLALALALFATGAGAQEAYPSRPIRIVVPYPAGASGADNLARLLGPKLAERWGASVFVENRPGAKIGRAHV